MTLSPNQHRFSPRKNRNFSFSKRISFPWYVKRAYYGFITWNVPFTRVGWVLKTMSRCTTWLISMAWPLNQQKNLSFFALVATPFSSADSTRASYQKHWILSRNGRNCIIVAWQLSVNSNPFHRVTSHRKASPIRLMCKCVALWIALNRVECVCWQFKWIFYFESDDLCMCRVW